MTTIFNSHTEPVWQSQEFKMYLTEFALAPSYSISPVLPVNGIVWSWSYARAERALQPTSKVERNMTPRCCSLRAGLIIIISKSDRMCVHDVLAGHAVHAFACTVHVHVLGYSPWSFYVFLLFDNGERPNETYALHWISSYMYIWKEQKSVWPEWKLPASCP